MATSFDVTNPAKPTIVKDPNAVLDYTWDWAAWLDDAGDAILSAEIVFPLVTGGTLAEVSSNVDPAGFVTAFLSGGTVGLTELATCRITTVGGRTEDRTIWLKVKER